MNTDHIDWKAWLVELAEAIDLPWCGEDGGISADMRAFEDHGIVRGPNAYAYVDENGWLVVVGNDGAASTFGTECDGYDGFRVAFNNAVDILGTW